MRCWIAVIVCIAVWAVETLAYRGIRHRLFKGLEKIRKRQNEGFTLTDQPCFYLEQLEALKEQFREFIDHNDDGKATYPEVKRYLLKYNPTVTREQIEEFLARRDVDGDGEVDFIPDYISEVMSPEYSLSKAREWFKLEDTNKDGYVSEAELVTIAMNIGMTKDDAEKTASEYYMSADTNGDRLLDWDEYSKLFVA